MAGRKVLPATRLYRVGTFYDPTMRGKVTCYLRTYNPQWDGCVEYDVRASTGAEAKMTARRLRLQREAASSQ